MEITFEQINEIAELAASKAVEKIMAKDMTPLFRTKSAIALHLKCDRRTIDSMISRDEVIVTREGRYKINTSKPIK